MIPIYRETSVITCEQYLYTPTYHDYNRRTKFEFFDKDGFDLCEFERGLYAVNAIPVSFVLNKYAVAESWFYSLSESPVGAHIDHSFVFQRYGYAGAAEEQINGWIRNNPLLTKLTFLSPKWGIDLNIEYIRKNAPPFDILHIEEDFFDYNKFIDRKSAIEEKLEHIDFADAAKTLINHWNEWYSLTGDDNNDYKARFFGFDRAYKTYKVSA